MTDTQKIIDDLIKDLENAQKNGRLTESTVEQIRKLLQVPER
ncbi:hypothetical protein [Catenovulum sediminis]|nr:hypothetical protein [Catenovulum sediminis]